MENASKALIIAGEILIAILILSLIVYALGKYSEYKNEQTKLEDIENTSKFNEQFTNYDRDDVQGYELITLINKIVDYNERKTSDSTINANTYDPIKIQIDFVKTDNIKNYLTRDGKIRLFELSPPIYKEDSFTAKNRKSSQSFVYSITDKISTELNKLSIQDQTKAEKIAKNIEYIFLTKDEIATKANNEFNGNENYVYRDMANTYNLNAGFKKGDSGYMSVEAAKTKLVILSTETNSNPYYQYACHFYEYMQFKRSVFKCNKIEYNTTTGKVSELYFEFVNIK